MTRTRGRCSAKSERTTSLLATVILLLEGALMLLPLCFFVLQIALVLVLHLPQGSTTVTVGTILEHFMSAHATENNLSQEGLECAANLIRLIDG